MSKELVNNLCGLSFLIFTVLGISNIVFFHHIPSITAIVAVAGIVTWIVYIGNEVRK